MTRRDRSAILAGMVLLRILRNLIALVVLLPAGWMMTGVVVSLVDLLSAQSEATFPPTALALGGGFVLWIVFFYTLPGAARTYVLGHELTHALWALLMGAEVSGMKVSAEGGYVELSKSNFLITLAPYFFPLYTVLVVALHGLLTVFFDLSAYRLVFLGLVGLTWGFHLTYTIATLLQHQSDIRECGHLFSYSFIYLLNIVGISLWIVAIAQPTLDDVSRLTIQRGRQTLAFCERGSRAVIGHGRGLFQKKGQ